MNIPGVKLPKFKIPNIINKQKKKIFVLGIIGLIFLASSSYIFGATGEATVDINTIADIDIYNTVGLAIPVEVSQYDTVVASEIDTIFHGTLSVWVTFDADAAREYNTWENTQGSAPDSFKAILQTASGSAFASDTSAVFVSRSITTVQHYVFDFSLNDAPQGNTLCNIRFDGVYPASEFDLSETGVVGHSISFYIDNPYESDVAAPQITEKPADRTIALGENINIQWKYLYIGTAQLQAFEDDELLEYETTRDQTVEQVFSLSYTGTHAGDYEIKFRIEPTDGSGNDAVQDIMIIHVEVGEGGSELDYPPTVETMTYSVSGLIYPFGLPWSFSWGMRTAIPTGLQDVAISGVITIDVNDKPDGALSSVWIIVDSESTYYTEEISGLTGSLWRYKLDTVDLPAGIHTIEVYGRDSTDAQEYLLFSISIGIRTLGIGGIIAIIAVIVSIPVMIIITKRVREYMSVNRK